MVTHRHLRHDDDLLQAVGFLACFVLFLLPACLYGPLTGSTAGIKAFQFLYFFSSFWNQFGPNCTTFLVAGACFALFACCSTALSDCAVSGITASNTCDTSQACMVGGHPVQGERGKGGGGCASGGKGAAYIATEYNLHSID